MPNFYWVIRESLKRSDRTEKDIGYLAILHFKRSAHNAVLEELGVSEDRTTYLEDCGHLGQNDQVFSIELGLKAGKIKDGDTIVMVGAGLGFVWALGGSSLGRVCIEKKERTMSVNGKICLVTGAAQGIGRAIAELFAKNGAKTVIAADVKSDKVEEFAKGFDNIVAGTLNVTDSGKVNEFIGTLKEQYGTIDVLVNNAGITRDGLLQKTADEDWDAVVSVNLKGVFNMTRAVAPSCSMQGRVR